MAGHITIPALNVSINCVPRIFLLVLQNIDEMRSPSAIKFDLSCPDLPSYPAEHRLKQCLAKTCRSNADCELVSNWSTSSMQQDRVCCFNGCVSTCLPKMYPPKGTFFSKSCTYLS